MKKNLLLIFSLLVLFCFLLFINLYFLDGIPHVPDDAAYFFMAKMFSSGHFIQTIPVSPQHFDFFSGILNVDQGKWFFQYTFGHPILLAVGALIGFPNVIPPLVGCFSILFLFLIAKKLYGNTAAFFLLPLPFLSPFFLENAASFMSHNSASFYLILSLFFLLIATKKTSWEYFFLSGIFLGFVFNTRPLTSLPFLLIFASIIFLTIKQHKTRFACLFGFVGGFLILLELWFLYNTITSGNPFHSEYFSFNKGLFGVDRQESLQAFFSERWENTVNLFTNLGPMLFNWPLLLTFGLLFVPVIYKKRTLWDILFFVCLFTLPLAYFFYNGRFVMYGPRFWYEIMPFVFLLTARAFALLYKKQKQITLIVFIALILLSLGRLSGQLKTTDPDPMSPLALTRLEGINSIDDRILQEVKRKKIHNAVVLVTDCFGNWWCYGSVFSQNNATLTTDIIYAKDLGDVKNRSLFIYYPNRSFYRISYSNPVLESLPPKNN